MPKKELRLVVQRICLPTIIAASDSKESRGKLAGSLDVTFSESSSQLKCVMVIEPTRKALISNALIAVTVARPLSDCYWDLLTCLFIPLVITVTALGIIEELSELASSEPSLSVPPWNYLKMTSNQKAAGSSPAGCAILSNRKR